MSGSRISNTQQRMLNYGMQNSKRNKAEWKEVSLVTSYISKTAHSNMFIPNLSLMIDFVQVQAKKYERMISDFKPNLQKYKEQVARSAGGDESNSDLHTVYRGAHSLAYADPTSKPSSEALERVKEEIVKQDRRRAKFTKRKAVNEDDDITYINERNRRFNEQVSKAFDKYTEEIRDNFERGTAL